MGKRIPAHKIESKSINIVRNIIDNENSLFREFTGRDYGIDGLIELFDNDNPSGMFAFVQIKGTSDKITPLIKQPNIVSCKISSSTACYAHQRNIPVILMYVSINAPECIYYTDINIALEEVDKIKIETQKEITVHIPFDSIIIDDLSALYRHIKSYYNNHL